MNTKAVKWDRGRSRETEKRREIAGDGGSSGREQKRTTTAAAKPTTETETEILKGSKWPKAKRKTKGSTKP